MLPCVSFSLQYISNKTTIFQNITLKSIHVRFVTVNGCNCFSFNIVLVSPNNGQLCMVNSTQSSKGGHLQNFFFKAQGFPYQ
jgi:hypothetical protein